MSNEQSPDSGENLTPEEINSKLQSLADALDRRNETTEEEINQRKLEELKQQLTESDLDGLSDEEWKILFEQEDQEPNR